MALRGKNINLFLMDGTASGRIKCTIANWIGISYKIPRTEVDRCKDREDLKQSGVYFLFGISEETGDNLAYIGQARVRKNGEGLLYRINEHKRNSEKDYWTEAIVFTTLNNSFGPTEISYLENKFCQLASQTNRYQIKNGNEPSMGNITEEKESELEEFIDYAKIIMGTLGHKIFEPILKQKNTSEDTNLNERDITLYLKRKIRKSDSIVEATCKQTREGFILLKGSYIETIDSDSIPNAIKELRNKAKIDDKGILQEDLIFKSPSYAAAFVIGGHVNGLTAWKTANGVTLKELENS
ncbi:MAG: methionine sulfoxide reductase [Epulopiscium sp. Nuni2H_MBin003]|nr:MAG: methionine sulfoxide reductase [Epulopiscium sp. Nuni2H_MBin003]